jgi:hypothetical protein
MEFEIITQYILMLWAKSSHDPKQISKLPLTHPIDINEFVLNKEITEFCHE